MFSLPVTRAVSIRDCMTFRLESSNLLWPNGSSDSPKSKVSVGITDGSKACDVIVSETCRLAARFAAFAFAIWSRNAAEDLRVDDGGSSRECTVGAVEVVDGLDRLRLSPDVLGDLPEAKDPCRTGIDDRSEVGWLFLRDGMDGLLNKPLMVPRVFMGRAARVFEPNLGTGMECFSGLGVLGPIEAAKEAREDILFREGRCASFGVFLVTGVAQGPKAERRLDGVPWTVANGGL